LNGVAGTGVRSAVSTEEMEAIASEFPDICHWFEVAREPACEVEVRTEEVKLEPYDEEQVASPTAWSAHPPAVMTGSLDDLDLKHNAALRAAMQLTGCRRSIQNPYCELGESCPFVRQMLGLDELPISLVYTQKPKMQRILVMKQTNRGLVKVTETQQTFTSEQIHFIQQLSPENQMKCLSELSMVDQGGCPEQKEQSLTKIQNRSLKEPLKVQLESRAMYNLPTPSPSPPSESENVLETDNSCSECSNRFRDSKQLLKHRRNHHQMYICKECGEKMVGYYKMASHSKKVHSKEPIYFCECGRNFGEKKGMTKHQNTCALYKQTGNQMKVN